MASDRALTDFSRPTKRGATIWGKTTISLKGNSGSSNLESPDSSSLKNFGIFTMAMRSLLFG
jgi:hypothetical protein